MSEAKIEPAYREPPPIVDIQITVRVEREDGDTFNLTLGGKSVTTKSLVAAFRAGIDFLTAQPRNA